MRNNVIEINPPTPEYYVANCLINMKNNKSKMKKYQIS